ncbi:hypothetical protein N0V90_004457 [Kalmusia sp. IMI 367209]|nr:hypothetical protein N0V90_004457 [Kalmusia sp. IMI 367209]
MPSYVIVGASRGIGYQFLKTLSKQDPSNIVIGLARSPADVEAKVAADNLKNVHILHGDMDSAASLNDAAKKSAGLTGGVVDYLVVNGAYFAMPTLLMSADEYVGKEDLFIEEMNKSMQTNVAGTLFAFNAFLPLVLKSSVKRVAAITSAAADRNYIFEGEDIRSIHYSISKGALNILVAKFAARYKNDGVVFASISPGFVATHDDVPKEFMDKVAAPLFRFDKALKGPLTPEQSVEACLKVLANISKEQSGDFLSQWGNKVWLTEK